MKSLIRANTVSLMASIAREFPDTKVEIEFQEPEPLPAFDYREVNQYASGGKMRNGGKPKWKGRDNVKAARKQRSKRK